MSRNSKPRYVLLQFEEDKTTIVKRTDVVDWLDYGKTIGRATVDGVSYIAKSLYFNGKRILPYLFYQQLFGAVFENIKVSRFIKK